MPRPPLSERACEAALFCFALWTLCANLVVATGGSLRGLIALYLGAGAVLFVVWRIRRAAPGSPQPEAPLPKPAAETDRIALPGWLQPLSWIAAAGAAILAIWRDDPILTWGLLLLVLLCAALAHLWIEAPRGGPPPRRSRAAESSLLVLAALCAVYALVAHRPDADDAFYVNVAVAAIDLPDLPLQARDTLHGRLDLPLLYPIYRLHSFELGNAAIALLTGIPPLYVFHWIAAALGAFLVPLCHALLFRQLTPRIWPWTTLALVVVLFAAGETHRWYGNFAFVRMWQGKAFYLFVFLPLVYAYALRFAQRGDATSWLRLAAAQIAALGCSATALWGGPIGALMVLCCVLRPTVEGLRRLLAGALTSGYVIAAGLLMKSQLTEGLPELARSYAPGVQLADALVTAFGDARLHAIGIASIFLAWVCCPPGLARRFAIALPLAVTAVLLNPWTDGWVRANVVGPYYWRVMWALPAPILLALIAVAPLRAAPHGALAARLGVVALLAAFTLLVPRISGFDERNHVRIHWPALKVGEAHRWSQRLNELAPRQRVVAPPEVATWVTVWHDHAYPMVVLHYLRPLRKRIGENAYRDRVIMTQFADGVADYPRAAAIFERGLDLYDVRAVCIRKSEQIGAREILRRSGFVKRIQEADMEIWSRAGPRDRPMRS